MYEHVCHCYSGHHALLLPYLSFRVAFTNASAAFPWTLSPSSELKSAVAVEFVNRTKASIP